MDCRMYHRNSERRPLKPELEEKLWNFVYDNKIAENNYPTLFEVFEEYHRRGGAEEYGVTEIEYHFHNVMIPNLFKTDALTPNQIMDTFYKLKLPIRPDLRPILALLCKGIRARCDKRGRLMKFRIVDAEVPGTSTSSYRQWTPPPRQTIVPLHVETAMWRHIEKHSKGLDAITIQTLAFWRKMKLREEDRDVVNPEVLVNFFTDRLRHYMFALKLNPVDKIELIDALFLQLSPGKQRWLLRVDGIAVKTNESNEIASYRFWRDEEPQVDPSGKFWGLDGYCPLERYVESIDVWEGLETRRQARREMETPEMYVDQQQVFEFRKWMSRITGVPEKIRVPVVKVVENIIQDVEDRMACDGILEQIREESSDEMDMEMMPHQSTSRMVSKRVKSPSAGPDAKMAKVEK